MNYSNPPAPGTVKPLPPQNPPRSPLFQAALALLGQDPDPLATLFRLRDAFPQASHRDIQAAVRETAATFHCAGIAPKGQG